MTLESKVKLNIVAVSEPKEVGTKGAKKLTFKGIAPDGKEYLYQTFSTRLFDHIKPTAVIEADVDISTHEYDGNTYTDRKVVQIYLNGQPVMEAKQSGGVRGNYGGKPSMSPEQWAEKDRIERRSIERQVSVKVAAELHIPMGGCAVNVLLADAEKIYQWISGNTSLADFDFKLSSTKPANPQSASDKDFEDMGRERDALNSKPPDAAKSTSAPAKASTIEERLAEAMKPGVYNYGHINAHVYKKYGIADWKKLSGAQFLELLTDVKNCQVAKQ
jgi:hypothetical protein